MYRFFLLSKLEFRKPKNIRNLIFTLGIFLFLSYILTFESNTKTVSQEFNKFIPYIFLFTNFLILGSDFENNTDKMIFSGIFKRYEILLSKLLNMIIKGIFIWITYYVLTIFTTHNNIIVSKDFVTSFLTIVLYSFVIGSVILLLSLVTNNSILSGILIYILFFNLILSLIENAIRSQTLAISIKKFITSLPFYIANTGLLKNSYSLTQSIILFLTGCVCLAISIILINIKNI